MSKKHLTVSEIVMSRIGREKIAMKSRWYFTFGSLALAAGLFGSVVVSVFFISLISFSLRTHGPMGDTRFQQLVSGFPWWAPAVALVGLGTGIWLLRKYDFSYKRNFVFIIIAFITAVILSGWLIDYLGIDALWARQGQMKRIYQKYDGGMKGSGWRMQQDSKNFQGAGRGRFSRPN